MLDVCYVLGIDPDWMYDADLEIGMSILAGTLPHAVLCGSAGCIEREVPAALLVSAAAYHYELDWFLGWTIYVVSDHSPMTFYVDIKSDVKIRSFVVVVEHTGTMYDGIGLMSHQQISYFHCGCRMGKIHLISRHWNDLILVLEHVDRCLSDVATAAYH
jgi:hypothetical protein